MATAQELLALLWLVVILLSGMLVSAAEISVSVKPSKTNAIRRIVRIIRKNDLFT
jgi:hypothetical protein